MEGELYIKLELIVLFLVNSSTELVKIMIIVFGSLQASIPTTYQWQSYQ